MRTASTPGFGTKESLHAGLQHHSVARIAATILGATFLAIGLMGFVAPGWMGAHLSLTHNLIHLVSGAASLYFGLFGSASGASLFCIIFGSIYGLLAIAGFALGGAEQHTIEGIAHGADSRLLSVIPGSLELATPDHLIHTVVSFLYLAAGILDRPEDAAARSMDRRPSRMPPPPMPPL